MTEFSRVAILGSGNIGTDLMMKVLRNGRQLQMGVLVGVDPQSDGLARARSLGVATTAMGVDDLVNMPEFRDIDIVFDATSAGAHAHHNAVLQRHGVQVIDLTPRHGMKTAVYLEVEGAAAYLPSRSTRPGGATLCIRAMLFHRALSPTIHNITEGAGNLV